MAHILVCHSTLGLRVIKKKKGFGRAQNVELTHPTRTPPLVQRPSRQAQYPCNYGACTAVTARFRCLTPGLSGCVTTEPEGTPVCVFYNTYRRWRA